MKTVLGIDVGTQSVKTIVYDFTQKKIIAEASCPLDLISADDGTREQKAEWWIDAINSCLGKIDKKLKQSIVAIGVSGQQHGFVPVDKNGNVLYNVKLWCDTSTVSECAELTKAFGGEAKLMKELGNLVLPGYTVSKILWLKKNKPDLYKKLDTVMLPHDYLNYYFTGSKVMEYGDASGTAVLDIRSRNWSDKMLKSIDPKRDLSKVFPELIEPYAPAGKLKADIAKQLGLTAGIIVSSGGGDNMMAAIGTGTVRKGVLTASFGTSGTLFGYSEKPIAGGAIAGFCSSTGGWLPLVCTMNCTVALELARKLFDRPLKEVEELVSKSVPGCDGIIILPFYNGERTPNLPAGKGSIMGLTANNMNEANILRASMESAVFGLKYGLDEFKKLGFTASEVMIVGGGAKSRTWRQMTADIFGLPVKVPAISEAAALGGALQALWAYSTAVGEKLSISDIAGEHVKLEASATHKPNPANVKKYKAVYDKYLQYLTALEPIYKG